MSDTVRFERFARAQEQVIDQVRTELRAGQKKSHWMWFVFPQLRGLGHSPTAQRYAIASLEEAQAFLGDSHLGSRLIECTRLINAVEGRTIDEIFGFPDDLKFRSCMTLFARAAGDRPDAQVFRAALAKYFGGEEDPRTVELLQRPPSAQDSTPL